MFYLQVLIHQAELLLKSQVDTLSLLPFVPLSRVTLPFAVDRDNFQIVRDGPGGGKSAK